MRQDPRNKRIVIDIIKHTLPYVKFKLIGGRLQREFEAAVRHNIEERPGNQEP